VAELSTRIVVLMAPAQVAEIDEYMWLHRLSSRGHAVRALCEAALKLHREQEGQGNKKPLRNDPERPE
jgi:hypothetical protein